MKIEKLIEVLQGTENVTFSITGLGEETYSTKEIYECLAPLLEKQIAKVPLKLDTDFANVGECPNTDCNNVVFKSHNPKVCSECGQMLKYID